MQRGNLRNTRNAASDNNLGVEHASLTLVHLDAQLRQLFLPLCQRLLSRRELLNKALDSRFVALHGKR